ncbi:MAG: peptidylprolyl isomerase [Acidimicrobiia bacterium]|nr:peptidylprolyl isomerase [Acidimicrobiia bacterium]
MKPPRVLLVGLVALALVAVGCGDGSAAAATVNGVDIPRSDVEDQISAIQGDESLQALFGLSADQEESAEAQFTALWLTQLIQSEVLIQAAEDKGVEIDDSLTEVAERLAARQFSAPDPATGQANLASYDEYPEVFREATTGQITGLVALVAPESGEDLELSCGRHVLISTQPDPTTGEAPDAEAARAEAEEVQADLAGGADFATVAAEHSDDPGSAQEGGDLGCLPKGATVPEFDDVLFTLPEGEISDVVETEFGFHVMEVTSREAQPFAEYSLDERENIINAALNTLDTTEFQSMLEEAEVTVDPSYGTWVVDESGARVEPPESATPQELPADPNATQAPSDTGQVPPDSSQVPPDSGQAPQEAPTQEQPTTPPPSQ